MQESAGSVLSLNLRDREEITVLPDNEYELQILRASAIDVTPDPATGKVGKKARIQVIVEAIGEPTSDDIFYTIFYPNDEDTPKQRNKKIDAIARFMEKIGLDPDVTELSLNDWIGCKFTAILGEDEYEGQAKNVIKKIVAKGR